MADRTAKKAPEVVTGEPIGPAYPEGTHPARPVSETYHGQPREYRDNPDKPDPTSIAQIEVVREDR
jgi:hypothetical protein